MTPQDIQSCPACKRSIRYLPDRCPHCDVPIMDLANSLRAESTEDSIKIFLDDPRLIDDPDDAS